MENELTSAYSYHFAINWHALLLSIFAMIACLTIQATSVVVAMEFTKSRIYNLAAQKRKLVAHSYFYLAMLILLIGHLLQIAVWGYSLYRFDVVANPHVALTLAGSTYTTVGFVSDTLPQNWQLVMVVMAISGLFSFAWSTSIMFNLTRGLYPIEN